MCEVRATQILDQRDCLGYVKVLLYVTVCIMVYCSEGDLRNVNIRQQNLSKRCTKKGASCSVLQCAAVYYSVLQRVAACCSMLQYVQYVAVCCSMLQCVAVCCSVLQCVAMCCSMLQCRKEGARSSTGLRHQKVSFDRIDIKVLTE